ncbi:calcineurin-like phosphoesterase family protein [Halospina denitrificans]|uniref:Calcineurin-like phosphoesterase family protein n=1 Tax=Halospina denitrificans TaxID=332522 RepID=A0A4R7K142_9GAMM|nr:metallophosphoesterase [Halospina denitrificans]TDT44560.1 calcineurin-like phosphoesterase family protein [Halospina denitrificans]
MYDLIGDIHGHADELKALLTKLGYEEKNGVWQHPERKVIFLGDFIDRGPEQVESVRIPRAMVEAGHAMAVMGNHEFNAIAWAKQDPKNPGEYLRPHTDKNRNQHQVFLDAVGEDSSVHAEFIEWFEQLPFYLDLPELRVVHACWHPQYIDCLQPFLDGQQRALPNAWPSLTARGTVPFEAAEVILKGLEIPLPEGHAFEDKDGNERTDIRAEWWNLHGATYRDLAFVPPEVIKQIPHKPIPEHILPGYDQIKPVFVGHYWLSGEPELMADRIACLDYSIGAKGLGNNEGCKLVAYRWQGESALNPEHFVWVS